MSHRGWEYSYLTNVMEDSMTQLNEVYRCEVCGNLVEVVHAGIGELVCCGQPMKKLVENTVDASKEKHVPVVERTDDGILVKVGSVAHPMEAAHYIEWIEVIANGKVMRAQLNREWRRRPGSSALGIL